MVCIASAGVEESLENLLDFLFRQKIAEKRVETLKPKNLFKSLSTDPRS